jgi:hypothetical protein
MDYVSGLFFSLLDFLSFFFLQNPSTVAYKRILAQYHIVFYVYIRVMRNLKN